MAHSEEHESLAAFKDSFSYGSRSDLNFKFLRHLSPTDAGRFFQELLRTIGIALDDGDYVRVVDLVVEWQRKGYASSGNYKYPTGPFTPLAKPLAESRLALIASTGHFVDGDDPMPFGTVGMSQADAIQRIGEFIRSAPQLSEIPMQTPLAELRVRHGGYDIHGVMTDPNVAFPISRLLELAEEGIIGRLLPSAYSFVGAALQAALLGETGRAWSEMFVARGADAALLVPV